MSKTVMAMVAGAVLLGGLVPFGLRLLVSSSFGPPQRAGPPALVMPDGEPQVWLLTTQEERRHVGGFDDATVETLHHVDLRSYDSRTARPLCDGLPA